jgi:Ca2+-binding EF-hand superfamily protein
MNFTEFLKLMLPVFTGSFDDDALYFAFKKFDTNNSGYITAVELKQVLAKIGQNYTQRQIEDMIATVDKNGDGRLGFQGMCLLRNLEIQLCIYYVNAFLLYL